MSSKYKYKYKKRGKRTRKTPMGRRRKSSMRSSRIVYITRDSTRDSTNLCHYVMTGVAGGTLTPFATTFQFGDMVGVGEMKSLFDNYKITKVAYRYVLARDADYTSVNPGSFVRITTCKDYNSQVALTAAQIRQYTNSQEIVFKGNQDKTKWFYMKPAVLQLFYVTSVTSSTGPVWNKWIDTSQDTVPHYALHMAVDNLYTGATLRLEVKISVALNGIS